MQNLLFRHEVRSIDDLKRAAKDSTFTGSESRLAELMPNCQSRDFSHFKLEFVGDVSNPFAL